MAIQIGFLCVFAGSAIALVYAFIKTKWVYRQPVEGEKLLRISGYVAKGAMAFLKREFTVLIPFVLIAAAFLAIGNTGLLRFQAVSFAVGAAASALAGYVGMKVATAANSRTTHAARDGIGPALRVSFAGGSVMGMSVVGLSLLGILIILGGFVLIFGSSNQLFMETALQIVSGFSLGASSMALFARVGGGIFTKAADVGADLVGKIEAGIPEDDPRNPATIADNVGDNVGDVAGMGADLFESYVGSIVGSMILGAALAIPEVQQILFVIFPLIMAATGILASIIGTRFVKIRKGADPQRALNAGTFTAAAFALIFTGVISYIVFGDVAAVPGFALVPWVSVTTCAGLGLVCGIGLGLVTEYFTGTGTRPVKSIVKASETGAATNLITGMGVGMVSAFPLVLLIVAAILAGNVIGGLYGVGIAALGMLMTLGIQLSVDAYGPIADNAGGLAEMSELPPTVREVTDKLDAVGNTTAAIGKGFAIGSAALTSVILFSAFRSQLGLESIDLFNINVLAGILVGAVVPYLFSSLAMQAIGAAAFAMIEEVRRQFRERPGILADTEEPDYERCVAISTTSSLKRMILPGILAAVLPVLVGFVFGVEMLTGLLIGVTASGVVLAIFMSNSGGAWDNAKKMIEGGESGGKGSESHKAAVVGDTVGDPFKDTAGPSLNILIKLMAVVSLVIAPMLKSFWG